MKDLNIDQKHPRPKSLLDKDDLREILALRPGSVLDADPTRLEAYMTEFGQKLNEAYPMPRIRAPDEHMLASRAAKDSSKNTPNLPFSRRRSLTNRGAMFTIIGAIAASFAITAILFQEILRAGNYNQAVLAFRKSYDTSDPIAGIEAEHRNKTAPPHPEALDLYDRKAADALLDRAEHLFVLWRFHLDSWYLQEALRNLLEAFHYQKDDPRILDALGKVYDHLEQPAKAREYKALAEKIRSE